jgi:hypothetical protein
LEKIKRLIEAIENKRGHKNMDKHLIEAELHSLPHNTLAYFLSLYGEAYDLKDLLEKDKETLVDLMKKNYHADSLLILDKELGQILERTKDNYYYFVRESGSEWKSISLNTLQYELDHSGQYGKSLMDDLLHSGTTIVSGKLFKAVGKQEKRVQ